MARKIYQFSKYWRVAQFGSAIACIIAFVLLFVPGPNYGIDFAGGTNILVRFSEQPDDAALRAALAEVGFNDASVVRFGESETDSQFLIQTGAVTAISDEAGARIQSELTGEFGEGVEVEYDEASGDRVYVRIPEGVFESARAAENAAGREIREGDAGLSQLEEPIAARVASALDAAGFADANVRFYGNPNARRFQVNVHTLQFTVAEKLEQAFPDSFEAIDRVETVGPRVGEQLRNDAVQAILFALVGILLYIAVRFDLRYAPGAVVALAHDVLITLGIFVILREEISLPILAALLTIVGYSLNDTIVNFDRVRENLQTAESRGDFVGLIDRSVSECISRTVLTSVTTLIAVVAIYILGGGLIRSFALAMIIGVFVGTYSSIFVASPVLVWMSDFLDEQAKKKSQQVGSGA